MNPALALKHPVVAILCCCFSLGLSLSSPANSEPSRRLPIPPDEERRIQKVVELISSLPKWNDPNFGDAQSVSSLRLLDEIALERSTILRKAIERLSPREKPDVGEMSKVFLVNHYIFDLPEKFDTSRARFFSSFQGIPGDSHSVNFRWPFIIGKNGKLELVGHYRGYIGADYQAVDEFDWFEKTFGRRKQLHQ